MSNDIDDLIKLAKEQGWEVLERNGKLAWFPAGSNVSVVTTPRAAVGRGFMNYRAELRRAGLDVRPEHAKKGTATAPEEPKEEPPMEVPPISVVPEPEGDSLTLADELLAISEESTRVFRDATSLAERWLRASDLAADVLRRNAELEAENSELRQELANCKPNADALKREAMAAATAALEKMFAEKGIR